MSPPFEIDTKKAQAILKKRIANIRYTLIQQAQYQAMQSTIKPVKAFVLNSWKSAGYKRKGKKLHRIAIISNVKSLIRRPKMGNILGMVGIGRGNRNTIIVNILDPGFKARSGEDIPGKNIRPRALALAVLQAKEFKTNIEKAALRMLSGARK